MSYFEHAQTKNEINASTQLKSGKGTIVSLIIHIAGNGQPSSGRAGNRNALDAKSSAGQVWRVWDAIGAVEDQPGSIGAIVFAGFYDNPRLQEACVVELDVPCKTGIYLEVPTGGVCSAVFA
jgi:hypothetical protein